MRGKGSTAIIEEQTALCFSVFCVCQKLSFSKFGCRGQGLEASTGPQALTSDAVSLLSSHRK